MAKNLKLFFDPDGSPRARGPSSEKLLMAFLESDLQGSDQLCRDLMNDLTAVEEESVESREFIGNAHSVVITTEGVTIEFNLDDIAAPDAGESPTGSHNGSKSTTAADTKAAEGTAVESKDTDNPLIYKTGLRHFREVLEDWEAFILDEQTHT